MSADQCQRVHVRHKDRSSHSKRSQPRGQVVLTVDWLNVLRDAVPDELLDLHEVDKEIRLEETGLHDDNLHAERRHLAPQRVGKRLSAASAQHTYPKLQWLYAHVRR